jgi:hypothetical protein
MFMNLVESYTPRYWWVLRNIQNPKLGGANGRKGQRQQLRDDKGFGNGAFTVSGFSLQLIQSFSPTTCATPGEDIFSEEEHGHPLYMATQNNSREQRVSWVLNAPYDLGGSVEGGTGDSISLGTATTTNSNRRTDSIIRVHVCLTQHPHTLLNLTYLRTVRYQTLYVSPC